MGWHGTSMTAGSGLGAPIAGVAIDLGRWPAGFLSVCVVGLAIAVVGALAVRRRRAPGRVDELVLRESARDAIGS